MNRQTFADFSIARQQRFRMSCVSCASGYQAEFSTEMNIHVRGPNKIDELGVLAFPQLLVCLDCGFSWFTVSETELACLARDQSVSKSLESESVGDGNQRQL